MPEPLSVLDVRVVTGAGGGPDKTILNSPRFLESSGYRMICAYMHPPGDPGFDSIQARAEAYKAPLEAIPDRGATDLSVLRRLLAICRNEKVAIWHGHDYKSNVLGLLLRQFHPMRLVTTVHGWVRHTRRTPLYYGIDRFSLPFYERVICVSDDLQRRCIEIGVSEDRCLLIENAIDTTSFRRRVSKAEAKGRLGLDPDRLVVGGVGRLSPEKGFDRLLLAVDRLHRDGLDIDLVIGGDGDQQESLEALARSVARPDRIRLLGYCDDPLAVFEALDVFVLSSVREGLPNVLLEAMALGVPSIATRVGGVRRLVSPGETGLLVEPGDESALADAIGSLLRDASLRDRFGDLGREAVIRGFGFDVRMEKIRSVYDAMLGDRIGRPASGVIPT